MWYEIDSGAISVVYRQKVLQASSVVLDYPLWRTCSVWSVGVSQYWRPAIFDESRHLLLTWSALASGNSGVLSTVKAGISNLILQFIKLPEWNCAVCVCEAAYSLTKTGQDLWWMVGVYCDRSTPIERLWFVCTCGFLSLQTKSAGRTG